MATDNQAKVLGHLQYGSFFFFPQTNHTAFETTVVSKIKQMYLQKKKTYLCVMILRAATISADLKYSEFKSHKA